MFKTRKLNTTGQKLMAQELKDGRMDDEDLHPSSGSRAFYPPKHKRTTSPIVQRQACCLPFSRVKRRGNLSPSMGRTQSLLFPKLFMLCTRIYQGFPTCNLEQTGYPSYSHTQHTLELHMKKVSDKYLYMISCLRNYQVEIRTTSSRGLAVQIQMLDITTRFLRKFLYLYKCCC